MRVVGPGLAVALVLGATTPASAELLTCRDWGRMSAASKAVYVHGVREGITVGATESAVSFLADLAPADQIEAAEEVASDLVADAPVRAYVSMMTRLCADPGLAPDMPLALVFLRATDQLEAQGRATRPGAPGPRVR